MSATWWRRNRGWLALLLPALVLALAASAFRLTTLYWPWQWSRGTVEAATSGTLHQRFLGFDDNHYDRTVQVTVAVVERAPSVGDDAPVDGGVMWRVELELAADPDQMLRGTCHIELVDGDGVSYGVLAGKRAASPDDYYLKPVLEPECVPEDAPGPELDVFSGELIESPVTRPRTWTHVASVVTPAEVTPERLRIGWSQPEYLELRLP